MSDPEEPRDVAPVPPGLTFGQTGDRPMIRTQEDVTLAVLKVMGVTETTRNLLGPFWRMHSPPVENGGTIIRSDTPGEPMFDRSGAPVAGAEADIWHSSPVGLYENQDENQADYGPLGAIGVSFMKP